jgi:protein phosphatase 1 regulatory subunit 11
MELTVVCCIYHRPKAFGESSSDESSSSSDSDDSDDDLDNSRRPHEHRNGDEDTHDHKNPKQHEKWERKPSLNAYERQPRSKKMDEKENSKNG